MGRCEALGISSLSFRTVRKPLASEGGLGHSALLLRILVAISLAVWLAACGSEPTKLCDGVRFSWALDDTSYSSADDVSDEAGLQIGLRIRVALDEGEPVRLLVATDEEDSVATEYEGEVGVDGIVEIEPTLPEGRVTLTLVGDNGCREVRSSRAIFVFDGEGDLSCSLSSETAVVGDGGSWTFTTGDDEDVATAGIQVSVVVSTGRAEADISLVEVDTASGETATQKATSPENGEVAFVVTVPESGKAVRARCTWPEEEITRISVTRSLLDVTAP